MVSEMKTVWQMCQMCVFAVMLSSCRPMSPEQQYVRQKIPVDIQMGKPITIEIASLSGNGMNDVGIRCPTEVWDTLTNGTKAVEVRLKSSNRPKTEIGGIDATSGGTFLGYLTNVHYLFYVGGQHHANASVEITFTNAPPGITHADIIVGETPADTGP